ncbi:MAG: hypothetical protein RHS_1287 [Robinsoniella sp. RHS]|nr:MAG: hypothetical protein RHS_1287 [Robinsoniella sp. RHS]
MYKYVLFITAAVNAAQEDNVKFASHALYYSRSKCGIGG